jgi:hypothetical protein
MRALLSVFTVVLIGLIFGCGGGDKDVAPTITPSSGSSASQPSTGNADGSLSIPSLEIDAPVVLKRLHRGEALPSPDGPDDVALYDFGSELAGLGGAPGQGGNVVLSGRNLAVDNCEPAQPPCNAVFRTLRNIQPGALIELKWMNDSYSYQAVASCLVSTVTFGDGIYRRTNEEQLTLLTGAGNWGENGFSHVLIVIAKPAPRTAKEPCPEGTTPVGP